MMLEPVLVVIVVEPTVVLPIILVIEPTMVKPAIPIVGEVMIEPVRALKIPEVRIVRLRRLQHDGDDKEGKIANQKIVARAASDHVVTAIQIILEIVGNQGQVRVTGQSTAKA